MLKMEKKIKEQEDQTPNKTILTNKTQSEK